MSDRPEVGVGGLDVPGRDDRLNDASEVVIEEQEFVIGGRDKRAENRVEGAEACI